MAPPTGSTFMESTPTLSCIWLNAKPGDLGPQGAKFYKVRRIPAPTSETPMQFPRGIGVDLQASHYGSDPSNDFDSGGLTTIKIMFAPSGSVENIYFDDVPLSNAERVYFLLGAFENGNGKKRPADWDFITGPPSYKDEVNDRMSHITWLTPDSRWLSIAAKSGRVTTAENRVFDPMAPGVDLDGDGTDIAGDDDDQIIAAREYAASGISEGGR